jgi:hypothetical protein
VLLFALSLVPKLPPWHRAFQPGILAVVDVPSWAEPGRRRKPKLRGSAALDDACELAELWHWRAKRGRRDAAVAKAARAAKARGAFEPIDGDFPYGKIAFGALSPERAADARSAAFERHYAFAWLTSDEGEPWDRVDTST